MDTSASHENVGDNSTAPHNHGQSVTAGEEPFFGGNRTQASRTRQYASDNDDSSMSRPAFGSF